MTDKFPSVVDAQMATALDRFDLPPLSADFADRVMAALDAQAPPHDHLPSLPATRPARNRRFGWARRKALIMGATVALGVASMSAAATGLLADFGIRIPVVTDYVTKHLGIRPAHLWHHAAKQGLPKVETAAHTQVIHSTAFLPVAQIPVPTPAQIISATENAAAASPSMSDRRTNTPRAVAVGGGALAVAAHRHRPPVMPVHTLSFTAGAASPRRQPERPHAVGPAELRGPKFSASIAVHQHPEAIIHAGQVAPPLKLMPAPIGSIGHPVIPEEITRLHSPEERALERATREHSSTEASGSGAGRQGIVLQDNANLRPRATTTDRRADAQQGQPLSETPAARQTDTPLGGGMDQAIRQRPSVDHPVGQGAHRAKTPRPVTPHAIHIRR